MAIIGATELQPVNVVSNYLAGQEARRNQLAQQQQLAMQQQQMMMQQRAAQREEAIAAEEAQRNSLLRSTLASGGGSQALMQAGLFEPAMKLGQYEESQAQMAREDEKRRQDQSIAAYSMIVAARKNPSMWPVFYDTAARTFGVESLQGLSRDTPPTSEQFDALESAVLPEDKRRDFELRGAAIDVQKFQAETARSRLAEERRQFDLAQQNKAAAAATAAAGGLVEPPAKLKPGEKWNPEKGRVEAVPGTELYIKQSRIHGTDYKTLDGIRKQRKLADDKINKLLAEGNKEEFKNLFGGYSAYATQRLSGKTANLRTTLESLKNSLKTAGLQLIKQGSGQSIGQITQREWPILEGMIDTLSPEMEVEEARTRLAEIQTFMESLERSAVDTYEMTWGDTQFKQDVGLSAEDQAALEWANANPRDPRAAQIKRGLGM